jgi:hypothetical protein
MCGVVVRERVWIQEGCFGTVRSCGPWLRRWCKTGLSRSREILQGEGRAVLLENVHESLFIGVVYLGASTAPSPLLACRTSARAFSVLVLKPTAPSSTTRCTLNAPSDCTTDSNFDQAPLKLSSLLSTSIHYWQPGPSLLDVPICDPVTVA